MNMRKMELDCSSAIEYADLVKHCWIGFGSITIGGLMQINRQTGGDTLDVLNGLIDAGIDIFRHLDWRVRARIVNSSAPPTLVKDDKGMKAVFEPDDCVGLVLRVEDGSGSLITYLTPCDLEGSGWATWMPAWCLNPNYMNPN